MGRLTDWAVGAVGVALVSTILLPRRNSSVAIIEAMGNSYAQTIKAAMGGTVSHNDIGAGNIRRMDADQFHAEALTAIAEFWKGFGENWADD